MTPLDRARTICLALPESTEKKAWGAPTFRVKGKMFAMFVDNHHDDGRVALWLNAAPDVQAMLVESDPKRYFVPPYQGPKGWIGVRVDGRPRWTEVAELIEDAWHETAPPSVLKRFER